MDNPLVESIWYQPPSDGVQECVSIELPGGPKRFLRIWPGSSTAPEWGWVVHETAQLVWSQ